MLYICCLYNIISRRINFVDYYYFFFFMMLIIYFFYIYSPSGNSLKMLPKIQGLPVIHALPSIVEASKSSATVSKYKFDFEQFRKWCTMCSLQSSPATSITVIIYIGGLI